MKITPDLKAQILARHKAGDSQRKIQKMFNLSAGAVNKITKGVEQNLKSTINKGTQYLAELSDMNEYEREAVILLCSSISLKSLASFNSLLAII